MNWNLQDPENQPAWDDALAATMIGATVLVGMTYEEPAGVRQEQFVGTVMNASLEEGIVLRLEGARAGEVFTLPPDLRGFAPAPPGSYRLKQTGEVVLDPDFTSTWTMTSRAQ